MPENDLWATIVKIVVENSPAIASFIAGGAGGGALGWFFAQNAYNSADFRILTERTYVDFIPGPKSENLDVRVDREFELRLKEGKKRGRYGLKVDLRGNSVRAAWEDGCQMWLNDDPILLQFEDERRVVTAKPRRLGRNDRLRVILKSTETISKARRFYSLSISNPKDQTTFRWKIDSSIDVASTAKAYGSSEDFDLVMFPIDSEHPVKKSDHQVTYFIIWEI